MDKAFGSFLRREWLPAIEPTIRASTFVSYEGHVRNHIGPRLGRRRLRALDGRSLNAFYASLLGAGLSPRTVRRVHATLHRSLRDAVRWGYLAENPAAHCDPPRARAGEPSQMRTWSAAELRSFLATARSDRLYALWLLLALTGMRRGEALGLGWRDVDLERKVIAVRRVVTMVRGRIEVGIPKTARGNRIVALDDSTVAALARRRTAVRDDAFVFVDPEGDPLNPSSVTHRFRKLVAISDLPRIRLHDLRHTHATLALQAGVHPKIVSERLGHASVAFTLDVYSHAVPHMQSEAAVQIAELVLGRPRRKRNLA